MKGLAKAIVLGVKRGNISHNAIAAEIKINTSYEMSFFRKNGLSKISPFSLTSPKVRLSTLSSKRHSVHGLLWPK